MPVNKVIYGSKVLLDLTADTVTSDNLLKGATAHKADGSVISGKLVSGTASGVIVKILDVDAEYVDMEHITFNISNRTELYNSITAEQIIVELTHLGAYVAGLILGGRVNTDISPSYDPATGIITITAADSIFDRALPCKADIYITAQAASAVKKPQIKIVGPSKEEQQVNPDTGFMLESVTVKAVNAEVLNRLDENFKASNIKECVALFGITGTLASGGGVNLGPFGNMVTGQITPNADTGTFPIDTTKGSPIAILFRLSNMNGIGRSGDAIVAMIWLLDINGYENRQMRFWGNLGKLLNSSSSGVYDNGVFNFEKVLKKGWTYDYCILYG